MATINFNYKHFTNNGHTANPTFELDGYAIGLIQTLLDCAKLPFTINWITKTDHTDNNTLHSQIIIETDISAMDNPVKTIADMDLVLGKYIDWEEFVTSEDYGWEYQIAGFYDYNDNLVIIFHYEI